MHDGYNGVYEGELPKRPPWTPWFAWYPVKNIHGQRQWLKTVYRRVYDNDWYEYGTIFDVLKDA